MHHTIISGPNRHILLAHSSEVPIEEVFEERARAGDGNYAVAFALLKLAHIQETDMAARSSASYEQMLGLKDIAGALRDISTGMSVELSGKVDAGG